MLNHLHPRVCFNTGFFFSPSLFIFNKIKKKKMQESLCWDLVTHHMLSWVSCLKKRKSVFVWVCVWECDGAFLWISWPDKPLEEQIARHKIFCDVLTQLVPHTDCVLWAVLGRGSNKWEKVFLIHLGDLLKQILAWKEQAATQQEWWCLSLRRI